MGRQSVALFALLTISGWGSACGKAEDRKAPAKMPDKPVAPTIEGQAAGGAAHAPIHGRAPGQGIKGLGGPGMAGPPHGGIQAAAAPIQDGVLKLKGMSLTVPKGWKSEPVTSKMRAAQFVIDGGKARLVVFYFGERGAGSAEDNIARWVKQFAKLESEPATSHSLVKQMKVTRVELAGIFGGGPSMRPGQPAPEPVAGYKLLGAVVESPKGPYYIKLTGPKVDVDRAADAFADFLESATP